MTVIPRRNWKYYFCKLLVGSLLSWWAMWKQRITDNHLAIDKFYILIIWFWKLWLINWRSHVHEFSPSCFQTPDQPFAWALNCELCGFRRQNSKQIGTKSDLNHKIRSRLSRAGTRHPRGNALLRGSLLFTLLRPPAETWSGLINSPSPFRNDCFTVRCGLIVCVFLTGFMGFLSSVAWSKNSSTFRPQNNKRKR